ncbi:MAG: DUF167 domain-containing protein [Candidatus Buchananbacteria bacterium]|nr:DUF167 domain-containing protein [Candidatus Buchananbacteria bacterium]
MNQEFTIVVVARARVAGVINEENGLMKVKVTAPAINGRANEEAIDALAAHFKVKRSQISIRRGLKNRHKLISIAG